MSVKGHEKILFLFENTFFPENWEKIIKSIREKPKSNVINQPMKLLILSIKKVGVGMLYKSGLATEILMDSQ